MARNVQVMQFVIDAIDNASRKFKVMSANMVLSLEDAERASNRFALAMAAVGGAAALLGASAVRTAGNMEAMKAGLIAVAGSSEEAERQLIRLREVAKLPGLGFAEAVQGSINLQAAGFSAQMAERSLKAFGNALATVGKGRAELDGVIIALQQIVSKGKVSAEEINQLNERLPQIRKAMIAAFGTADTEALQKMNIDAQTFVDGVVKEFEKLPPVMGGFNNTIENIRDSWAQFMMTVGSPLMERVTPLINRLSDTIAGATTALTRFHSEADRADAISQLNDRARATYETLTRLKTFIEQNAWAVQMLGGAIAGALMPSLVAFAVKLGEMSLQLSPWAAALGLLAPVIFQVIGPISELTTKLASGLSPALSGMAAVFVNGVIPAVAGGSAALALFYAYAQRATILAAARRALDLVSAGYVLMSGQIRVAIASLAALDAKSLLSARNMTILSASLATVRGAAMLLVTTMARLTIIGAIATAAVVAWNMAKDRLGSIFEIIARVGQKAAEIVARAWNALSSFVLSIAKGVVSTTGWIADQLNKIPGVDINTAGFDAAISKLETLKQTARITGEDVTAALKSVAVSASGIFNSSTPAMNLPKSGGSGDSDAEKAAEEQKRRLEEAAELAKRVLEQNQGMIARVQQGIETLRKDYGGLALNAAESLRKLDADHTEKLGSMQKRIDEFKRSLEELNTAYTVQVQGFDTSRGEEVIKQEQKIADIRKQIAEGQKNGSDTSALMNQLAQEEAALRAFMQNAIGLDDEIAEARRRNGLTEFERFMEDVTARQTAAKAEYEQKKKQIEDEMTQMEAQKQAEIDAYAAKRDAYLTAQNAFNSFHENYLRNLKSIEDNSQTSLNRAIAKFNELKATMDSINGLTGVVPNTFSGGGIVPQYRAGGGFIDWSPRGTDTVPAMLTPGELVLNRAQQRGLAGQLAAPATNITINVTGNQIRSDADIDQLVDKIGRALARKRNLVTLGAA